MVQKIFHYLRYDWPLHFVLVLTNWLPDNVIFLRLRGALARPFLGSCGKNLRLGRNITFHDPAKVQIGKNVFLAYGCLLMAADRIRIDDEVMFGPYCVVVSGNHTRQAGSYRYGDGQLAEISIGRGAWIGAHAVITAGSRVGCGTLVAAGAVVTGDIPDNVVAGGIPARMIKEIGDHA